MQKKAFNKSIALLLLLIIILSSFSNIVSAATSISSAYLIDNGDCGNHLQYYNSERGRWSYVFCTFVTYEINGIEYPAYCLNKELPGVDTNGVGNYTVNIDSVLDNDSVWRVIINGYPYQTPEQMGVENKYDAFIATKQAVYCILYGTDPSTHYRGGDARGTKIANAIVNLVNIGRYGTQTQYNFEAQVSKSQGLYEDGNYYSQNYNVTAPVNMSSYVITATNGLPSGSKITDLSGNEKTTFSSGEQFKVSIPKNQLSNNLNITISVSAYCKTYPVFYGKTTISGTQDYAVTYDPYSYIQGIATLNVNTNTGKIQINKTDSETNKPIPNVTFQLLKSDGTVIANSTTNENGIATFSNLHPGIYTVKEIETNDCYLLDTTEKQVYVEYDKTTTLDITNNHKKGNLKIYKVDKDNHKVALGNVIFDLYSNEFNKVIGTYTTNVNGEIEIRDLRIGSYKLIEKNTGKWYNLAKDTTVNIKWNTTSENTIENELKKGQIRVIKIDKENKEVKLEGVSFEVLDAKGRVLETIITDKNGEALTSRYAIRDYENLTIREKETLENYVLSDETKTITLEEDKIKTITFENEKKKGQIRVIKVDKDNKEVKLEGVTFDVLDEKGKVVDTIKTNSKGEATSKKLPIDQKYTVVEKQTLKEYVLTEETQTVTLKQDQIKNLTFENEKKKGQIKVIKVDKDNNEVKLEGVTFNILDEQKNIVDTVVTDKNGEATSIRLPIDEKYTVVEKQTLKEYVLTKDTQTVKLKQDEITTMTFENEKIKGYVEVTKIDSKTNEKLKGAIFGIYNLDNKLVETIETNELGKATSKLLNYGKYYLKELDTGSVYYLLNENTFEFEITKNHVTVPLTVENEGVDIRVNVDKEGTTEIKPNDKVDYVFSNITNESNVYLENFKWIDYIPTDYIRLENMTTGTWNQDLYYSVYYKTNKSDEYILFKDDLNTQENYNLDFTTIELTEDEYIVETMYDFGKVDIGFKENISPTMQCKSLDNLEDGQTFTNYTKTVGTYFGITAEANSKWTTIIHVPIEVHEEVLPRTGK